MGKPEGICGIELGKDALSLVHYTPEDKTVTSVAIQPLDESPWPWWESVRNEFKPLVRDVRASGRPLTGTRAVCSVPAEHAVVTRLMVDTGEPDVETVLRWELAQQLAGRVDEYTCDFQKQTAVRPGPISSYLAAACRATWASRVQALMRSQKLVPAALDVDVFALVNAFEANYHDALSTPALLILGGEEMTKVVLTWNGGIVDFECYRFDPDAQDPEAYVRMLLAAAGRLQAAYPSLSSRSPLPCYASGVVFTWDKFAAACFRSMTSMQMLNPFRAVNCTGLPESSMRLYGPRLAVAVGLAVRGVEEATA